MYGSVSNSPQIHNLGIDAPVHLDDALGLGHGDLCPLLESQRVQHVVKLVVPHAVAAPENHGLAEEPLLLGYFSNRLLINL